ncbi:S-adenosyl-L-methionine-dependent methyltransferase [Glarea lozoyensis ATCC 20868]|uniref:S-adenosyl-L-methionine-dependent methyltransferase n=1 Tax=Glarea lozoyensis (strain ATCC 20868 / MF5171) TaxID=1116229 RepID=S3E2Z0_GLAL2|nr:S-adenosyl-L-methionine-dependent methyltransferase [Glarea lozoyensis ATCC 20868]EPE32778.1 S-adenosyl-L-methionine-dependent methyltransferase [Glarea lozoyensis ATCC 20868]
MAEAAFFASYVCVNSNNSKNPSSSTHNQRTVNGPSKTPSVKHKVLVKKSHRTSKSISSKHAIYTDLQSSASSLSSNITTSLTTTTSSQSTEKELHDRMFLPSSTTPLPDYKHAANQSSKTRAQAQARAQANRTSSSTGSSRSKHANSIAESHAAAAARGDAAGRSSSISSNTASSGLTQVTSSEAPPPDVQLTNPFARKNGRRYLRDTTLPYPLPCDLTEIHRQTLRTMLLCQVFNGPICSPAFDSKPPKRVLEVGCGTGFWSVMCHRHFSQRGFSSIAFTGIDIAPLAPRMESDDDMNWRFIQHDLRRTPLPLRDDEFNLIMIKDMSLIMPTGAMLQALMDEYLRVLKPGGTLEIWDGDHALRMLLPHTPPSTKESPDDSEDEEQLHTNAMGTYTLTPQTPLATAQNQYLADYNTWMTKSLELRKLTPMPCTTMRAMLLQESEDLVEIDQRRLAIPLGEVRWEREGVGGTVTQGANAKGKSKESDRKILTAGQAALRRTALLTVVQMIESLEPMLKEASGKGQDEWDRWQGNMMNDLLKNNGTSWGECLEVGAWWARKKKPSA